MKVYICFELLNTPGGGGNNFLNALQKSFYKKNILSTSVFDTQIILLNSHHSILRSLYTKLRKKNLIFVHRIDGPMRLYNDFNDQRDFVVNTANNFFADATVFQSKWSRAQNYKMGFEQSQFETIIMNAPDSLKFNRNGKTCFDGNRKTRLVASSWSTNWKKGFSSYQWLDENLDFSRYEMTFVGNSPVKFKNIKHLKPLFGEKLACELKKHDIYITASQKDPCSNSLLEAMHCGLPAVALNDGGHSEIVGQGGLLFETADEIPRLLEEISSKYEFYQDSIELPTIDEVGQQYLNFMSFVYGKVQRKEYQPKKIKWYGMLKLIQVLFIWKIAPMILKLSYKLFRKQGSKL